MTRKWPIPDKSARRSLMAASLIATMSVMAPQPGHTQTQDTPPQDEITLFNTGTLTCTVDSGDPSKAAEPRDTSCLFEPISGPVANFSGTMRSLSDPSPTADRIVLVWTVFATSETIAGNDLERSFKTGVPRDGADRDGYLISEDTDRVELRPLVKVPDAIPEDALLVLELDLKFDRA